jgi:hypothetical protein
MSEIWKDIPGYEQYYQVSNYGRVRSLPRTKKTRFSRIGYSGGGHVLKSILDKKGYKKVALSVDGKVTNVCKHVLVALAFIDANPDPSLQINHKDGNKGNNRVENLEWVTASENMAHSYSSGIRDKTRVKSAYYYRNRMTGEILKSTEASKVAGYNHAYFTEMVAYGRYPNKTDFELVNIDNKIGEFSRGANC